MENNLTIKPLKMAITGWENGHSYWLYLGARENPLVELVAVSFGPRERIVHENRLGAHAFDDLAIYYDTEQMLNEHPEIEACIIGGSNDTHMRDFKLCAERGVHIVSMKVPTLDSDEYQQMIDLKEKYGIKVHIELEMRWHAEVQRVKELMNTGALGEITSFCAYNYSHYPMWWMHWMDIPEKSYGKRVPLYPGAKHFRGGALTDHPHIFDLVRYMTGSDFDTVYAEVAPNMRDGTEEEDLVYIIGKMKNGVIVSLDPSYANREPEQCRTYDGKINMYPRPVQVELAVNGTKGAILCDAYGSNTVESLYGKDFQYRVGGVGYQVAGGRGAFLTNFVKSIRLGGEYKEPISLIDHRRTITAINACYDSIYYGKEIKVKYHDEK